MEAGDCCEFCHTNLPFRNERRAGYAQNNERVCDVSMTPGKAMALLLDRAIFFTAIYLNTVICSFEWNVAA